ncbi:transcriptional regulator [Paenibacillus montaniterrae]|uniref:Transcriptional regulator n=1 Tax=Paenibacillus montaniterrae TaxID=429341 RepID=A0A919YSD0_9BACL|nr:LytTR family transcriptional regulator DNA-binding domain-containing protein [Paenibacillus montaniterrae]GIP17459.1 transcriptional regulator [Paenibacillus montaniterrae]
MRFALHKLGKIEQNQVLLPELSLSVEAGEIVAVQMEAEYMQTLFALMNDPGLYVSDKIEFSGDSSSSLYLCQREDGLYKRLNARQTLKFWSTLYGADANVEELLALCELNALPLRANKRLTYSEQRRLHFARALIQPASAYLFEDPTYGLDLQSKYIFSAILERISADGGCVLIVTSSLEEAILLGTRVYRFSARGLVLVEEKTGNGNEESEIPESDLRQVKFEKILAKVEDKIILFNPLEIDYLESRDGQTLLFVNNETFVSSTALKELEIRLVPFGFFRCHRSYLVNLQRVREIIVWSKNSYSLSLDNKAKSTIPLSKGNYAALKQLIHL